MALLEIEQDALQVQSSIVVPLLVMHAVHREKGLGIGESFAATFGGMQRRRNMHCLPRVFSLSRAVNLAGSTLRDFR